MERVVVILAPGFEEGEALAVADVLHRAEVECDLVGLTNHEITGAHDITVRADKEFSGTLADYGMVVLPGGYGGAEAMRDDDRLLDAIRELDASGKWIAAICAAPLALGRAGLLSGRSFTCYPTTAGKIENSGTWVDEIVHVDGRLVTSQGPGTAYAFAYVLVELLGADAEAVKQRMVYYNAFDVEGE